MRIATTRTDANNFLLRGTLALADVEANGIYVDVPYVRETIKQVNKECQKIKDSLEELDITKEWKSKYGEKYNLNSTKQLSDVLYQMLKLVPVKMTKKGNASVDGDSLKRLDCVLSDFLVRIRKFKHVKDKLMEIYREQVDGVIHPIFHLHTAVTYRGSAANPNFQNQDAHDMEMAKILRQAFIPRTRKRGIGEFDYKGIEVCVGACYHRDSQMITYIKDKTKDMHRDVAMRVYKLDVTQVSKPIRFSAKNCFVFPEFYGDYYVRCAKTLWDNCELLQLKLSGGTPLREHLRANGFMKYKAFEKHVQNVEKYFWEEMFKEYAQWKWDYFDAYVTRGGYINTYTGFRCSDFMARNDVVNYPIQGSAFHCLLWSLIELNKVLKKGKFETKIIGQIHDSIVLDYVPSEIDEIISIARKIMTKDIVEHWPWINVPLTVDVELSPAGKSWFDKEEYKGG